VAFDGIRTNRVNRHIGLSDPVASGERGQIYDADPNAVLPRLEAAEAEIDWLRSKIGALGKESKKSAISGGAKPTKPTNLQVISQTFRRDSEGRGWVDVVIAWDGAADAFEVAFAELI